MANIFNAVFHHHQPVDSKPPSETTVLIRINTAFPQDIRVYQAAAQKLDTTGMGANLAAGLFAKWARQGKFETGFGKWEIKWLGFNFQLLAVILFQKGL